jgi:uncharacterized protein (DUF697 family)
MNVEPTAQAAEPVPAFDDRQNKARAIIRHSTKVAAWVGLVPIPLLDMVGLLGVQATMIRDLARLYDLEIGTQRVKTLLVSLSGSVGGATIGKSIALSLLRGLAAPLGVIAGPSSAATFTWAVGTAFNRHFQAGGQLHTFSNAASAIREEITHAASAVGELLRNKPTASDKPE